MKILSAKDYSQRLRVSIQATGKLSFTNETVRCLGINCYSRVVFGQDDDDPVNFVYPSGEDWYYSDDDSIQWTDYKSQEELNINNISGRYIGSRVVIFNGSYSEQLGKGDNIYGDGAITASVDVYGHNGAEDIGHYTEFTLTSDFEKFGAIADGFIPANGGAAQYFLRDHLGSVRVVATDCSTVVRRTDYLPFGVRMSGDGLIAGGGYQARFGFGGKENVMGDVWEPGEGHWSVGGLFASEGCRCRCGCGLDSWVYRGGNPPRAWSGEGCERRKGC